VVGVLLVGLLLLAAQCPNGSSSLTVVLSANPTSGTSPLTVNFDASSSSGSAGSILMYEWSFGDEEADTGKTVSHTYRHPDIYTARLTVTDDDGNVDSTSRTITVTAAVGTPPSAGFTATPSSGEVPLAVTLNASASFDPDGSITSYAWSFDDGVSGAGVAVTHTYTSAGTYYPLLCVTDDDGNQDYAAQTVHILSSPNANNPPTANFTASPTSGQAPLAVSFNGSGSSDSDGSITSYAWSFGDGGSSSGVTASHTYNNAGTYTARLTVTDDDGSTDSVTRTIQASGTPVANNPPTASFTASPTSGQAPLAVSFNASGSSDSDGTISSYAWTFGDGGSSSGITANHTYSSAGTYTVTLTVQDNDGATDATTTQIEVTALSVPEDLYVNANSGSDTTGDGTQGAPYKTITKAVDMADAGSGVAYTVHVAAGIYNIALGETFPLVLSAITLVGHGAAPDDVKIVGEIGVENQSTVSNILSYSRITLNGSPSSLRNCVIDNPGPTHGVTVYSGGEAEIHECVIRRGVIFILGTGAVSFVSNELTGDNLMATAGDLHVEGNTFYSAWVVAQGQSTATIRGNTFHGGGIGAGGDAHVVIEGNTIENNNGIGISASAVADLGGGPLGSTGGNVIRGSSYWNMTDDRIPYSGSLYAKNNTWDDPQPAGTVGGPADNSPNYKITNEGNSIIFSD